MSLNCNEIDVILSELELETCFIQEIVQPNFDSMAFYTYKPGVPKTVFVSLAAGSTRIHETRRKITKNDKPLRFNEMLRSKLKGARILSCSQIGKERIIKLELFREGALYVMPQAQEKIAKKGRNQQESGDEFYNLYIRLWSNAANIFLCDKNDVILDSFYRRPAKGEMKGEKLQFTVQSSQCKVDPNTAVVEQKTAVVDPNTAVVEQKPAMVEPVETTRFPVRTFDEIENPNPDYPLTFNQKVELYYSENASRTSLESLLEQAEKWYNQHKSRQIAALERLEEKRREFLNASQYKHQGDLILAYGMDSLDGNFLEVEDYDSGKTVRIKVDPKKSAHENASDYYELYKKQTGGLENLEYDIQQSKTAIENLDKEYAKLIAEKNPIKLEQLLRKTQKPKQQEKKTHPGLDYEIDGWYILVGRDATENDELLRHHVKGQDMWFHARDYHGGYVFVKNRPGKTIPLEIMLLAGNLAVYYSKARKNGSADLYYTQVKHLRRAKNGPKGLVLPTNEKNLHIKLDEKLLRSLGE